MKVLFKPILSYNQIVYEFKGDTVKAKMKVFLGNNFIDEPMFYKEEDVFDFSSLPEGTATDFETDLPFCPVLKASKVDGELQLVLVKFIDRVPATRDLYPKWLQIK